MAGGLDQNLSNKNLTKRFLDATSEETAEVL